MIGTIDTDRLILRGVTFADAPLIMELMNEPGYIANIGDRGVRSIKDAEAYIEAKYLSSYRQNGFGLYGVYDKAGKIVIGVCGFVKRDVLKHPDLGFAYLQRYWRQGYGLEAGSAALEYGRIKLGFREVLAVTGKENVGSMSLLEKLGFKRSGTVRLPSYADDSLLFEIKFADP